MPEYNTSGTGNTTPNPILPTAMWPGDDVYVFGTGPGNAGQIPAPNDANVAYESVTVGERSIAVQLAPRPGGGAAPGLMVQLFCNASPGAAEIDVQDAGIDADGFYATFGSSYEITSFTEIGASGIYTAWLELQPEGGKFITLKVVANPNGVKWIAKLSYV